MGKVCQVWQGGWAFFYFARRRGVGRGDVEEATRSEMREGGSKVKYARPAEVRRNEAITVNMNQAK